MDFASLDLKSASERGAWIHLSHNGIPLFADSDAVTPEKPCRMQIRGMAAKGVLDAFRKIERVEIARRDRMARTADKEADAVLAKFQAQSESAWDGLIVAAVADWENITYDGKAFPFNAENVLTICGSGTLFFAQVRDAITEQERLFTGAVSG